jgi:ElaB/YqjD/DUF883 family membrane-anchored ribosome-binding protein
MKMNDQILECLDDQPDLPATLQMNRIAHLWGDDEEVEMPKVDQWKASTPRRQAVFVMRAAISAAAELPYVDPVNAGVAALVGQTEETRLHSYIAKSLTAFKKEIEQRVEQLVNERVEAALSERAEARHRANDLLNNAVRQLKEKRKAVQRPPVEESWKMVDFSTLGEQED